MRILSKSALLVGNMHIFSIKSRVRMRSRLIQLLSDSTALLIINIPLTVPWLWETLQQQPAHVQLKAFLIKKGWAL